MLGMRAGLHQTKLGDFRKTQDYIQYLFTGIKGWICRGEIADEYQQKMYRYNGLMTKNFDGENVYISMNTFYLKERTVECLKRLNTLYVDIDCYKLGLQKEAVLYELEQDYFEIKIPNPTFVIDSGRGLYLVWKLRNEDRNALPRWTKIQSYFIEKLKCFGADPACKDSARILRVPFSANSKSGTSVKILRFNDLTYTISEIQREYHIFGKFRRKDGKKTHPYNTATEPMRRYSRQLSEKMGIELPDFEDFAATREWIAKVRVSTSSRPHREEKAIHINPTKGTAKCRILQGYCTDLETLFDMRKGADCKREIALFLYRLFVYEMTKDKDYALEKTLAFNARLSCPFPNSYVMRATKSAERKIDKGDTYHYKRETIIDVLEISREEMNQLFYFVGEDCRKERKRENNRVAYRNRLVAEGKETKAEAMEKRRTAIIAMREEGKPIKEILETLDISRATYYREVANITMENALFAATEVLSEKVSKESDTVENAVETFVEGVDTMVQPITVPATSYIQRIKVVPKLSEEPVFVIGKSAFRTVSNIQPDNYRSKALPCRTVFVLSRLFLVFLGTVLIGISKISVIAICSGVYALNYSRFGLCLVKRRVVFLLWQKSPPYGYRRLIDQAHFSRPSAAPKPEADSRSNQPPVPVCHSTGKTAVAAWWERECP